MHKWFNRTPQARLLAGGFGLVILIGAILLMLPISLMPGKQLNFLDALFEATSAVCVTGLTVVVPGQTFNLFGRFVLAILIQIGGLGIITIMSGLMISLHRRIGMRDRQLIQDAFNLNTLSGMVKFIKKVLLGTFMVEGVGALLYMTVFIPQYGLHGIWISLFNAVSAFCNAGFDILGLDKPYQSLVPFQNDPVVLFAVMALIVIGGLGFFVWSDIAQNRRWRKLTLYTKLVLVMTAALLLIGWAILAAVEWHNPETLGEMSVGGKLMNALFQSVTFRTAGFSAIDQGGLRDTSQALGCILMLIGGSSGSTAGGIKTVTVAVLGLSVLAGFRGRSTVTIGGRSIDRRQQTSATTLMLTALLFFLIGSMFLSLFDAIPFMDAGFEVASALGTVGLTVGITPMLSIPCRVFLILLMYLGRVGILSCSIAFSSPRAVARETKIKYPVTDVMIG